MQSFVLGREIRPSGTVHALSAVPIESNRFDSIRLGFRLCWDWFLLHAAVVDAGALAAIVLASLSMVQFSHRLFLRMYV